MAVILYLIEVVVVVEEGNNNFPSPARRCNATPKASVSWQWAEPRRLGLGLCIELGRGVYEPYSIYMTMRSNGKVLESLLKSSWGAVG